MKKQSFLERFKHTWYLRGWSFLKVPLINMMRPQVLSLDDKSCSVLIPLHYWTKNHFNSMYISSQVTGADLAAGLLAQHHIRKSKKNISILFKDIHGDFKKRPDDDTIFQCKEGKAIQDLVEEAFASGQRVEKTLKITAQCPEKYGTTVVSEFQLTLSIKRI